MEAMNLVEVVLNQGHEDDNEKRVTQTSSVEKTTPIKGPDESVSITVTRTPGRPVNVQRQSGKPANFALISSPVKNGRNSDAIRLTPREEMVCNGCRRIFKYKAAFIRHEAQCGLPLSLRAERAAVLEAKRVEKAAELEKRKIEEKQEKQEKPPLLKCPTCLKQFYDSNSFNSHNFEACAIERSTYTFVCSVCKARFKYKNHLRRHEDSHNNVRRYNCDVCTTAFLRPDHLKRHMMRMHGIVQHSAQSPPEGQAVNSNPWSGTVSSSDAKSTLTTIKNAPMQCPMCSKILSRRDHVLRHMRNVHHVIYEPRKRGAGSEILDISEGMMESNVINSLQDGDRDDTDGSENRSVVSHDGLMIDEAFENVKRESTSPVPDKCVAPEHTTIGCSSSTPRNLLEDSYHPNQPLLPQPSYPCRPFGNDLHIKTENSNLETNLINGYANNTNNDENILKATGRFDLHSASNHEPLVRGETNAEIKTEPINSSDGNQNVLCNGHTARVSGSNWFAEFASYSGW